MDKNSNELLDITSWKRLGAFGLYVPSYVDIVYEKPMENVIAYVTYKELFPGEDNNIKSIQKQFSEYFVKDVVQFLCKMNYIRSHKYSNMLDDFPFANTLLEKVDRTNLHKYKGKRRFTSRQLFLADIKLALIHGSSDIKAKFAANNLEEITKLIFRPSDFLESQNEDTEDKDLVRLLMARNMVFNEARTFALDVARYSYIFNVLGEALKFQGKKTLNKMFEEIVGVSFDFYLSVGFGIWGFYRTDNFEDRLKSPEEFLFSSNYFRNTNEYTRNNHAKALKGISSDFASIKEALIADERQNGELFSFQPFYKNPLIRDGETYYLIDNEFFERRLTEGAFWHIFDHAKNNKERMALRGYWGKLFEKYVLDLTLSSYGRDRTFSENLGDDTADIDVVVYYPNSIILIEVTTQSVPYNMWLELDKGALIKKIREILIKGERRGKAAQLYDAWKKVKSGKYLLNEKRESAATAAIPIIVFERSLPTHPGIWQLYEKVLIEEGYEKEFVDSLLFWSIEDLERVLGYVEKGTSFTDTIKQMNSENYLHNSVRNFYILKDRELHKPKFVEDNFKEWSKENEKLLFG